MNTSKGKVSYSFAIRNTDKNDLNVVFEPWLTEVKIEHNQVLEVDFLIDLDADPQLDGRPEIWLGQSLNSIAIYSGNDSRPVARLEGKVINDITY